MSKFPALCNINKNWPTFIVERYLESESMYVGLFMFMLYIEQNINYCFPTNGVEGIN